MQASNQPATPAALQPGPMLDLSDASVQMVAPAPQSDVVSKDTAKPFGVPAGNLPGEPTSEEILHTVKETSSQLGVTGLPETPASPFGGDDDFSDFGHTIDLALEPQAEVESDSGFIKDPLQRSSVNTPQGGVGSQPSVAPATRTYRVPVTVSARDFKAGATVRIVLDLRVDEDGQ